jgi:hypothetical protein
MTKNILTLLFIVTVNFDLSSQTITRINEKLDYNHYISTNLFGHGLLYSIGIEKLLHNYPRFKSQIGIAGTYYPRNWQFARALWFPIKINEIFSFGRNHIEIGQAIMISKDSINVKTNFRPVYTDGWNYFLGLSIGYRYQQPKKRFYFNFSFTPIIDPHPNRIRLITPYAGLTLGRGFNMRIKK